MVLETSVSFSCSDDALQQVYDEAERKCLLNLKRFGDDLVLVEGGGYEKIWLETQPMGGEMYALRNLEAAKNNCLLFMRHQRQDGRLPGSIQLASGVVEPQFNKYQGFCFPYPALSLYYLLGEDRDFLMRLRDCLRRFDDCLWRTRDSNGDGLLESFCVYDTGEDLALRYGDAPCWWTEDTPPEGYSVVPMASMDVMSWSYACRDTLALISRILGDGGEEAWRAKAAQVPVGGESLPPARQYLVACCLMPHVPDDAVVGRVEDVVQGHRELHHAQATGKVAGVAGHFAYDFQPQLVADLRQRLDGQTPKVGRDMYLL